MKTSQKRRSNPEQDIEVACQWQTMEAIRNAMRMGIEVLVKARSRPITAVPLLQLIQESSP